MLTKIFSFCFMAVLLLQSTTHSLSQPCQTLDSCKSTMESEFQTFFFNTLRASNRQTLSLLRTIIVNLQDEHKDKESRVNKLLDDVGQQINTLDAGIVDRKILYEFEKKDGELLEEARALFGMERVMTGDLMSRMCNFAKEAFESWTIVGKMRNKNIDIPGFADIDQEIQRTDFSSCGLPVYKVLQFSGTFDRVLKFYNLEEFSKK